MRKLYTLKTIIFSLFLFVSIKSQAQQYKQISLDSLMLPLATGASSWADFNKDGWLDLIIAGQDSSGKSNTSIYLSDSLASLKQAPLNLPAISKGDSAEIQLAVFDYDYDNWVDIILMGKFTDGWGLKIFRNKQGVEFEEMAHAIKVQEMSSFILGDFKNNAYNQLLVTGVASGDSLATILYTYKEGQFKETKVSGLPVVKDASMQKFDFNKDGLLDLFIIGTEADTINGPLSKVYLNQGGANFKSVNMGTTQLAAGDASLLDYNGDGLFDIVVVGKDANNNYKTYLYTNKEDSFQLTEAELPTQLSPISPFKIVTGDLNNDGWMEVILAGKNSVSGKPHNQILIGNGTSLFNKDTTLYALNQQILSLTDFNEDGSLDIFVSGKDSTGKTTAFLLQNTIEQKNQAPGFPGGKYAVMEGDTVMLFWDPGHDDNTNSNSITYNIWVWSSSSSVIGSNSNSIDNKRIVVTLGAQSSGTFYKLWDLPEGEYYWDVYAVDNSYKGSYFSGGGTGGGPGGFYCPLKFFVMNNDTIKVCENEPVKITFDVSKINGEIESIQWRTSKGVNLGLGTSITYTPKSSESVIAKVNKKGEAGCTPPTARFPIEVIKKPVIKLAKSLSRCKGEEVELTLDLKEVKYEWISDKRGSLGTENKIKFKVTEDDKIRVKVTPEKSDIKCSSEALVEIKAIVQPKVSAGEPKVVCSGEHVAVGPGNEVKESDFSFSWMPAGAFNDPTLKNPYIHILGASQWFYLEAKNKASGCISKDSVFMTVIESPTIDPGQNKSICLGESVQLGGNPTAFGNSGDQLTLEWSPAASLDDAKAANPVAKPLVTTNYTLTVKSSICGTSTASVTVHVNIPPPSGVVYNYSLVAGESVTLQPVDGQIFKWSPETGLSATDIANPEASPMVKTTYKVEVTDANGCKGSMEHVVDVKYNLFIPNLFSPNGDESNDNFLVFGQGIKNITFQVFARSGQLLWETSSVGAALETGWDGRFNGKEQPNGTYIWAVTGEFLNGSPIHYEGKNTGKFTLIR